MRADEILAWVEGPDVLDLGCTGHSVRPENPSWVHGRLRKVFPNVWGLDISPDNVSELRKLGYENVLVGDAQNFSIDRTFDTIVAGELIEHLENPGGLLESAVRHLKPGGRIVVTTPYPFGLPYFLYALFKFPKTCSNPQHTQWFCPETMHRLAERMGLRVQHWRVFLDPETSSSLRYNWIIRLMFLLSHVLPPRLTGNTMLFVMTAR